MKMVRSNFLQVEQFIIFLIDGGYDSFLNHSNIWYHLNAKPIISYSSNAVINQEGEEEKSIMG